MLLWNDATRRVGMWLNAAGAVRSGERVHLWKLRVSAKELLGLEHHAP